MSEFQIGDKVTAIYKTGKYIGEITEERAQHYLVRVLAVLTHPMQGDLHHPKNADVKFFMSAVLLPIGNKQTYQNKWSNITLKKFLNIKNHYTLQWTN